MHLRWNYQCAGAASAIHNFPEKRRKEKASSCFIHVQALSNVQIQVRYVSAMVR